VHGLLKDKGLITMCYATFCRQLSRHKDKLATPKPWVRVWWPNRRAPSCCKICPPPAGPPLS
jgi:hypothetical protein